MPEETPVVHEFPFEVPDNFAALDDATLATFSAQLSDYAGQFAGLAPHEHTEITVGALEASATLALTLDKEMKGRSARMSRAAASVAAVTAASEAAATFAKTAAPVAPAAVSGGEDEGDGDEGAPEVFEGEVVPAVTASRTGRPSVRDVAKGTSAPAVPSAEGTSGYATMKVAADVPNFAAGQQLTQFSDAARALSNRMDKYPVMTAERARMTRGRRPVTAYVHGEPGRRLEMKHFSRHSGIQIVRQFPDQLRVDDSGANGYAVAEFAAGERRLSGGSLLQSAAARVKAGRAITAAAAWCAPSEVIYELCELETLDGILSFPELQTSRGGWQIPIDGGPNFATIWNGIGNAGDTHLTEDEVEEDVAKVCTEIPCPDFEDVRLGVDYVCLTGGLLQRRGYPEIVARFTRGAMIALAHKMNMGAIQAVVAASGAAIQVPMNANGDDAASSLLSAVELAIVDIKYRNRIGFATSLEVVMPMWFLAQIRAALARRRGVARLDVTDAEILDWFSIRRAVPQFVYDWQDAFSSGGAGTPGGASALEELPTSGQFLIYPAGTWVKAVQDVVSLDTIYDSTNLQTNQYTAVFAEDGWAMLQMCPDSRLYEVTLDPSGTVGCCPPPEISL